MALILRRAATRAQSLMVKDCEWRIKVQRLAKASAGGIQRKCHMVGMMALAVLVLALVLVLRMLMALVVVLVLLVLRMLKALVVLLVLLVLRV